MIYVTALSSFCTLLYTVADTYANYMQVSHLEATPLIHIYCEKKDARLIAAYLSFHYVLVYIEWTAYFLAHRTENLQWSLEPKVNASFNSAKYSVLTES